MAVGRRPSVMKRNEGEAMRERAEGPEAPRVRSRESPFERRQTGEITVHGSARNFFVGASQSFRPRLAPQIKLILVLLRKLGSQRPAAGVHNFRAAFYQATRAGGR